MKRFGVALAAILAIPTVASAQGGRCPYRDDPRCDPFSETRRLMRQMERMMDESFMPSGRPYTGAFGEESFFNPLADVEETEKEMIVTVDLPGMEKAGINVKLKNGDTLEIQGKRDTVEETEEKGLYRRERRFGEFRKVILLPARGKESNITATYKDGVLRIVIPKEEEEKSIQIPVGVI